MKNMNKVNKYAYDEAKMMMHVKIHVAECVYVYKVML